MRSNDNDEFVSAVLAAITQTGEEAPSLPEKQHHLDVLLRHAPDAVEEISRALLTEYHEVSMGLREAQANQAKLRALLEKLSATPWHAAIFLGAVTTSQGRRAVVQSGRSRHVVGTADGVSLDSLRRGDEIFLANECNVIIAPSPNGVPAYGEIATFERKTPDGRLVVRHHGDEAVIVDAAGPLLDADLSPGDLVRLHRESWLAFEKLPRAEGCEFVLEDVPDLSRQDVGGQDTNLETLLSALTARLVSPEAAERYGLSGRQSILMVGPPGCGKTLMARVAASEVSQKSSRRCRFAVVKPGEWEDPYVGVTEQRIRQCFEALRRAAEKDSVVLFLDEIESIGRIRGGLSAHHSDRFLAALLTELDGFADRSNVAVLAASNRKDLIDPALLDRLSDLEIAVNRPDSRAAGRIFEIHLPESCDYWADGQTPAHTRRKMITTAVSRFYDPDGDNALCTLRFRDGECRTVLARDLASGRCFEQICRAARRLAFQRDVAGGREGMCVADMELAVSAAIERLSSTLTPRNVHAYLSDLSDDADVVAVEPVNRQVSNALQSVSMT